jgi:hypothetical protein
MSTDLDLMLFDFEAEHQTQPKQALRTVQLLLLDEEACRARAGLLRDLARLEAAKGQGAAPVRPANDFRHELALIREVGTIRAVERGLLDPRRLGLLLRDPDALELAHQAVTGLDADAPVARRDTLLGNGEANGERTAPTP